MANVVEIKSAKIVPFTLISSSISAVLAFIGAIIFAIIFALSLGAISTLLPPQFAPVAGALAGLSVTAIIAYPILTFLIGLSTVFLSVLLYNLLVPRVGGIKLGMEENKVVYIPTVPFALIISIIMAIWAFIIGLLMAVSLVPLIDIISTAIPLLTNATNATAAGAAIGMGSAVLALILIIGLPIAAFIFGFIYYALFALSYNYITTRVSKFQLNFTAVTGMWNELTSIPVIPAALSLAITYTILQIIFGILNLISVAAAGDAGAGVATFLSNVIGGFIYAFIVTAIGAWLYNFLAPRIGAIKLELE